MWRVKATRLEAFSDGVIAIIITIMVLELKAPHDIGVGGLKRVLPVFLSYVLSFVMVAIYWVNHHHLIHLAQKVDGKILWANIHLLFWMSLFPWVTAYLGRKPCRAVGRGALCGRGHGVRRVVLPVAQHHLLPSSRGREALRAALPNGPEEPDRFGHLHRGYSAGLGRVPLALLLIALPAVMYFMPDRRVEMLQETETHR